MLSRGKNEEAIHYLDSFFLGRFESSEEKSAEDGVGDDHGSQTDVWEEEGDDALSTADDRLPSASTRFIGSRLARGPVDWFNYTRLSYLLTPTTHSLSAYTRSVDFSGKNSCLCSFRTRHKSHILRASNKLLFKPLYQLGHNWYKRSAAKVWCYNLVTPLSQIFHRTCPWKISKIGHLSKIWTTKICGLLSGPAPFGYIV